ncbi:MAG TPA: DMT family transporter [Telmatospirillum sp.]|nr:DMT family transporter [Telmatospirillum sp.]
MVIVATVLLSAMWSLAKVLSARYPVEEVSFFRSVLAFIPTGVMVAAKGGGALLHTRRLGGHVWRSVVGVTAMVLGFVSYHLMPLADAVSISFTAPLLVTALSVPLLGEKVGLARWGAVIVGFLGVLLIIQPGGAMVNLGSLAALGGAVSSALVMVTLRQLTRTENPVTIVFYYTVFSSLLTALPLPFVWVTPNGRDWGLLILLGLVGGSSQYFMTRALELARAAVIGPFNYVSLLWAALFGWVIWGDVPAPHVFAGSAIVVASGLFVLYREVRKTPD